MEIIFKRDGKGSSCKVNVGMSIEATVFDEIEELAERNGLKKAHLLRAFFLRGLAAYRRDGKFSESTTDADLYARMTVPLTPELSEARE